MILPGTELTIGGTPERKPYFSPSQIKSAMLCMRKWHGETVNGWRQPDTGATDLGKAVHSVMQQYLENELDHELTPSRQPEAVLLPALKFLPHPGTPHMHCEQEVLIAAELFDTGKPLFGFLDVLVLIAYDEDTGKEYLLVIDLKTTSNLAYMKSEEELRKDPQALIYGWSGFQRCIEDTGITHKQVRFKHVYARTRGGSYGAEADCVFTIDELRKGLTDLGAFCRQMLGWEERPFAEVPYNLDACGKYRGCHLRPECAKTGLPVYGDSPSRAAIAQLTVTRQDQPKEKVQMSNAFKAALAKKKGSAAAAMGAMLGAPVVDALNPPDGDVHGESGLQAAPTDTVPDEDAPAPETPVDTVPSPDAGYVEQEKVLPPKADKAAGKRGAGKAPTQWTKLQTTLSRVLADDKLAALVQQVENALLKQMLEGKAKETSGPEVDALQQVLEALENGSYVVHAEAALPSTYDKASDMVTDQIKTAMHAVVVAKDALAKSTLRVRELDDGDDEEAAGKYRTEVFLPAKRNVKTAEEQVATLEAQLVQVKAAEEAEELQRRKDAEQQAAKAAQAVLVEKREDAVEDKPVAAAAAPAAQLFGAGKVILVKGAVPTRSMRGAYTHIDEIINPYRRRAEQQAMVAFYGAMKTDGDGRICELLMADIITGNYKLPSLICAPAMCTRLQDRVIDAISLHLFECFQPLR